MYDLFLFFPCISKVLTRNLHKEKENCTHGHGVDTEIYGDFINSHHSLQQKRAVPAILDEYFIIVN